MMPVGMRDYIVYVTTSDPNRASWGQESITNRASSLMIIPNDLTTAYTVTNYTVIGEKHVNVGVMAHEFFTCPRCLCV